MQVVHYIFVVSDQQKYAFLVQLWAEKKNFHRSTSPFITWKLVEMWGSWYRISWSNERTNLVGRLKMYGCSTLQVHT